MSDGHVCRYLELCPDGTYFCGGCQKSWRLTPVETKAESAYTEKDVAAIVAAVDAVKATKAVKLRGFGYAPGNYSCICFACGTEFI